MRILVTGANGYIGRHLCRRLLADGHAVRGLVRPGADTSSLDGVAGLELRTGDVLSGESLRRALDGTEGAVHLAGAVAAGRDTTYGRVNVEGAANLAAAASAAGSGRIVFLSSLAAQGPSVPGRPHERAGDEQPLNTYGRSKLEAERALLAALPEDRLTVLRSTVVYGPDYPEMAQILRWVRGRVLPVVPGLELSFVHLDDLLDLVCAALATEGAALGPYFVSDGEVQTMERLVDRLEGLIADRPALRLPVSPKVLGWLEPMAQRVAGSAGLGASVSRFLADLGASGWSCLPTEARARFGFEPRRSFEAVLPEVVAWYRDRGYLDAERSQRSSRAPGDTSST